MDYFQAFILSLVEGVSEFLPISSTGHLVLISNLLKISQTEFVKSFEIIIQLGAILAVVVIYWKTLISSFNLWKKILAALVPTLVIGLVFYKAVKTVLLGNVMVTVLALFIGGIILIIFEKFYQEKEHQTEINDLSYKKAFLVGLTQSISIIPGVSRSAATILGGLSVGLSRKTAVEFSFLLAIPTMAAATGLDLLKSNFAFSGQEYMLLFIGLLGSFITALLAVKFFLKFIQNHTFIPFGIYRIVLAILFWLIIVK